MDDDFDEIDNDSGDLKMYESYKAFNIDTKITTLQKVTTEFITQVAQTHLQIAGEENSDYIKSMCELESSNLLYLLKQVKYSEHVLDSLMRQLDSGGYMEPGLFETIRVMQKSGIEIALEVSKYLRTLPEYFKFLEKELSSKNLEIAEVNKKSPSYIEDAEIDSENKELDMSKPIMGTRELMLSIKSSKEALKEAIANTEPVDETPIIIDEDGIRTTED